MSRKFIPFKGKGKVGDIVKREDCFRVVKVLERVNCDKALKDIQDEIKRLEKSLEKDNESEEEKELAKEIKELKEELEELEELSPQPIPQPRLRVPRTKPISGKPIPQPAKPSVEKQRATKPPPVKRSLIDLKPKDEPFPIELAPTFQSPAAKPRAKPRAKQKKQKMTMQEVKKIRNRQDKLAALGNLTVAELKKEAAVQKIKGRTKMSKVQLVGELINRI